VVVLSPGDGDLVPRGALGQGEDPHPRQVHLAEVGVDQSGGVAGCDERADLFVPHQPVVAPARGDAVRGEEGDRAVVHRLGERPLGNQERPSLEVLDRHLFLRGQRVLLGHRHEAVAVGADAHRVEPHALDWAADHGRCDVTSGHRVKPGAAPEGLPDRF